MRFAAEDAMLASNARLLEPAKRYLRTWPRGIDLDAARIQPRRNRTGMLYIRRQNIDLEPVARVICDLNRLLLSLQRRSLFLVLLRQDSGSRLEESEMVTPTGPPTALHPVSASVKIKLNPGLDSRRKPLQSESTDLGRSSSVSLRPAYNIRRLPRMAGNGARTDMSRSVTIEA
jgi:hypothetical protein